MIHSNIVYYDLLFIFLYNCFGAIEVELFCNSCFVFFSTHTIQNIPVHSWKKDRQFNVQLTKILKLHTTFFMWHQISVKVWAMNQWLHYCICKHVFPRFCSPTSGNFLLVLTKSRNFRKIILIHSLTLFY